jgi:hypothetical protein
MVRTPAYGGADLRPESAATVEDRVTSHLQYAEARAATGSTTGRAASLVVPVCGEERAAGREAEAAATRGARNELLAWSGQEDTS